MTLHKCTEQHRTSRIWNMEQKPVVHWNSAMTVAFSHAHMQWALLFFRERNDTLRTL